VSEFWVVPGTAVAEVLATSGPEVMAAVGRGYRLHEAGASVNPDSYFLRFADKPSARVIALPAYLGGPVDRIGIKWISSFPGNLQRGLPRASAVLILNDYATGAPVACLEAAGISAARTAASAALTVATLRRGERGGSVGFVGTGVIATSIASYLSLVTSFGEATCYDLDRGRAHRFASTVPGTLGTAVKVADDLTPPLRCDVVVFATTAAEPYVAPQTRFAPGQVVLNISLRDLHPQSLLHANNVVDDVDHCLKAATSPHLAEQRTGSRSFINGTIGQLLEPGLDLDPGRATIVSPFGLGLLDVAVGDLVLRRAIAAGSALSIPGFFPSGAPR
jgi:N-[(2S)-2-amino-2-carboxyethyl]-L-glutamate dehydrogenase